MKKRLWVFLTVAGVLAVFCLGFFLGYLTQELTYDQIANYHAKIPAVYVDLGAGTPARAGAGGPERPSGTNIYPPPPSPLSARRRAAWPSGRSAAAPRGVSPTGTENICGCPERRMVSGRAAAPPTRTS